MAVKSKGKKKWVKVVALNPFNEQFIGETFVVNDDDAIGRKISLSFMSLTNDPKKQNTNIKFEITKKQGNAFGAEVIGYNLVSSSIKRLVRRNCNRIDESYIFKTSDNKKIRIKPIILTRSLAKGSVLKAVRKATKEFLSNSVSGMDYEKFLGDLLHHNLQKNLKDHIKKIYPVRVCEIKVMRLEKEIKKGLKEKVKKEKPEEAVKEEKTEDKSSESQAELEKKEVPKEEKKESKKEKSEEKKVEGKETVAEQKSEAKGDK